MSVLVGFTFYKGLRKRDAVQAVLALSLYVRPSVTSRSSIKTDKNGSSWFLARRLPSTYTTLCFNVILITQMGSSLYNFVQTLDLENFRHYRNVPSTYFDRQPSPAYHTERPFLCTAQWAWSTQRVARSVCSTENCCYA